MLGNPKQLKEQKKSASTEGKCFVKGGEPFFVYKSPEVGVLFLHGFTSTPYQFKELANYLTDRGLTIYAPCIAGHGTTPKDLMDSTIGDWIKSTEDALLFLKNKVKKVIVVGQSFGGNLAFYLANKYNNSLSGIVSIGTPVTIRWQRLIKLRMYTYGWMKRYYSKPGRIYKTDYIETMDQVSYPVIPVASLRRFFDLIKKYSLPVLKNIKSPILIIQAKADPVVNPNSAQRIHEYIGSDFKKVCWLNGRYHCMHESQAREEIYCQIHSFIQESLGKCG